MRIFRRHPYTEPKMDVTDKLRDDGSGRYDHTRTVWQGLADDVYETWSDFERAMEAAIRENEDDRHA